MLLREILHVKGCDVLTIEPQATLMEAVDKLNRHNCGSLVVCRDDVGKRMVGILTERDILRTCGRLSARMEQTQVHEVMTRDVHTGQLGDTVEETMGLMTEMRVRHLPILDEGRLVGLISIGDVVKALYHELSAENHYLKHYIQS